MHFSFGCIGDVTQRRSSSVLHRRGECSGYTPASALRARECMWKGRMLRAGNCCARGVRTQPVLVTATEGKGRKSSTAGQEGLISHQWNRSTNALLLTFSCWTPRTHSYRFLCSLTLSDVCTRGIARPQLQAPRGWCQIDLPEWPSGEFAQANGKTCRKKAHEHDRCSRIIEQSIENVKKLRHVSQCRS